MVLCDLLAEITVFRKISCLNSFFAFLYLFKTDIVNTKYGYFLIYINAI